MNPGGPGGSGTQFARSVAKFFPDDVRARFDIVGFDPRGIGASTPLRCFSSYDESLAILPPFAFPVTAEEERQQRASDRRLGDACARHAGPILDHMSTADVARDLDSLRQMVGDRRLTYLGYSYGTVIGQTYANLFPDRVRALVIDGVVDPISWTTGRGTESRRLPLGTRIRSDVGAQATLEEFFRLCDRAGTDCAFSGHSGQRFAAVAAQLRRQPAPYVDPSTGESGEVTYADLIAFALATLYSASTWPEAAGLLADLEGQLSPAELGLRVQAMKRMSVAAQEQYANDVEGSPGVACSDSTNPNRFRAWPKAADRAEREHGYFGRIWTWTWSACHSWPDSVGQDRYQGPWNARTANPVLILGNYYDPATRYQGAQTAARLLPRSRLLSYAGWGHVAFVIVGNRCVDEKVTTYLVTTRTPPAGTVCAPEGSPFGPTSAALASERARAWRPQRLDVPTS